MPSSWLAGPAPDGGGTVRPRYGSWITIKRAGVFWAPARSFCASLVTCCGAKRVVVPPEQTVTSHRSKRNAPGRCDEAALAPRALEPHHAFTLVELLVVVSIIALLIAILLPALKNARQSAKQAACLAHIRGIASAALVYAADDPNENAIPAGWSETPSLAGNNRARLANYAYGGRSGRGGRTAGDLGARSPYGWHNLMGSAHRPLNAVLFREGFRRPTGYGRVSASRDASDSYIDLGLYHCPSDSGFQGLHYEEWARWDLSSYDHFGTSYAANVFWTGPVAGDCYMSSNSPYLRPLSRVPHPAATLLFMENVGRYCWTFHDPAAAKYGGPLADDILPRQQPYPEGRGGPAWHGRGWHFNVAFSDEHAEYIKIKSYEPVRPYPCNLPQTCRSGCGESEGACTWIMIRGRGWQLDTLPAPRIQRSHPCPVQGRPCQDGIGVIGWPSATG